MDLQIYATIGDDSIKKTIFEADSDNLRQWPCKWLIYFSHYWTKTCNTKKARWLNLFDSDNFGRQWLTRGARTGAAPENAPLRLAILWYNNENAPSTSHYYFNMHLPACRYVVVQCTPGSLATFCSTILSYTWHNYPAALHWLLKITPYNIPSLYSCVFACSNLLSQEYMTTSPSFMIPAT